MQPHRAPKVCMKIGQLNGRNPMNRFIDEVDLELFSCTLTVEAIESAAGTEGMAGTLWPFCHVPTSDCDPDRCWPASARSR
jgi:hypothetical protein